MAVFLKAGSADLNSASGRQSSPLEVGLFPAFAGGVKFGGADAVGIAAGDHTPLLADWTDFHL